MPNARPRRPPGAGGGRQRSCIGGLEGLATAARGSALWWGAAGCGLAVAAALGISLLGGVPAGGRTRMGLTAGQRRCLWEAREGGSINITSGAAFESVPVPGGSSSMTGMVLKKSVLPSSDVILALPLDCTLALDSAMGTEMERLALKDAAFTAAVSEEIRSHGAENVAVPFSIVYGHQSVLLTLLLLRELTLGDKSMHPDYLSRLPRRNDLTQPLLWSEGEIKWLEGTLVGSWVKQYKPFLSSLHARILPFLKEVGYIGSLKFEDFVYAYVLVESRHFEISATISGKAEPVLVPVLDSINHCAGVQGDIKVLNFFGLPPNYRRPAGAKDQRSLVFRTAKTFQQGEEICYKYSSELNVASSIFTYGFSSAEMPDAVDVLLSDLPDVEPIAFSKSTAPANLFIVESRRPLPGELICTLRIRELPESKRPDAIDRTKAYGYEWCIKEQLEDFEAEARVWEKMGVLYDKAVQRQERNISVGDCSGSCSESRFEFAKRYRESSLSFAKERKLDSEIRVDHLHRLA